MADCREGFRKELTGGAVEIVLEACPNLPREEDGLLLMREQIAQLREFANGFEEIAQAWSADLEAGIRRHSGGNCG